MKTQIRLSLYIYYRFYVCNFKNFFLGGGLEWIQLAQNTNQLRAFVKTVINLRVLSPRSQLNSVNTSFVVVATRIPNFSRNRKTIITSTFEVNTTTTSLRPVHC
jgi:hypothetical protein